MKSDRRVRYTKQVIKESYLELLLSKHAHKITVKELCEKAEINRSTFYSHYDDIHTLTEELQMESIAETKQRLQEYSHSGTNMILYFVKILYENHLLTNKFLFNDDDNSKYFIRLFSECKDFILSTWTNRKSKLSRIQQEWLYTFLASGSAGILRTWIIGGMKESAEEVADFLNQLIASYNAFENE